MQPSNILPRSFYERSTAQVAHDLIGMMLVRTIGATTVAGVISETEAYGGADDSASHAYRKQTIRNKAMFGSVGHSYVYFIYGNHYCLNIVAKEAGVAAGAVLIRGVIPMQGIDDIKRIRRYCKEHNLTNGPGKIGQAFQVTREHNNIDMTIKGSLFVTYGISIDKNTIIATPRIGISQAKDTLWRFVLNQKSVNTYMQAELERYR